MTPISWEEQFARHAEMKAQEALDAHWREHGPKLLEALKNVLRFAADETECFDAYEVIAAAEKVPE